MAILDASFIVAAWDGLDAHHADARRRLELESSRGVALRINAGALVEASRTVRRLGKDRGLDGNALARDFLGALLAVPGCSIDAAEAETAFELYAREPTLSMADAWVVAQALRRREDVLSFDSALLAAAGQSRN